MRKGGEMPIPYSSLFSLPPPAHKASGRPPFKEMGQGVFVSSGAKHSTTFDINFRAIMAYFCADFYFYFFYV